MSRRGTIDHYGNDADEDSSFILIQSPVFRNPNANYGRSDGGYGASGRWSRTDGPRVPTTTFLRINI